MVNRRRIAAGTAALLLLGGGYVAVCGLTPLPGLQVALDVADAQEFAVPSEGGQELVSAYSTPTALGWLDGGEPWANSEEAVPIASLTKLVTALVSLEHQPFKAGTDGPSYTVGANDAGLRAEVLRQDGIVHDTPEGLQLTTRQMLELMLLPSSNNYAISYAEWTFGSREAFVAAAADWAESHELATLRIVEPSGLSSGNVAAPADMVKIARLALEHPVISEIVAEQQADIPGIGLIESTNPLIGEPGIIGLKTGTLFASGYNLVAAREQTVEDRPLTSIAVVMSRADEMARATDARTLLAEAEQSVEQVELIADSERIGTVTIWDGAQVAVAAEAGASAVLRPGETAERVVEVPDRLSESPAGTQAGSVNVTTPEGTYGIDIVTDAAIAEPDLWWRVTHPAIVLGWADPEPQ